MLFTRAGVVGSRKFGQRSEGHIDWLIGVGGGPGGVRIFCGGGQIIGRRFFGENLLFNGSGQVVVLNPGLGGGLVIVLPSCTEDD